MAGSGHKPDELRATALALLDKRVIRLEDTAKKLIKLLDRAVDQLQTHMYSGLGYKADAAIDEKTVKLLKEVTASFNSATDAQVRLDKTAQARAKTMSHDERKQAVHDFIMTLPPRERAEWLVAAVAAHDVLKAGGVGQKSPGGKPLANSVKVDVFGEEDGDGEAV